MHALSQSQSQVLCLICFRASLEQAHYKLCHLSARQGLQKFQGNRVLLRSDKPHEGKPAKGVLAGVVKSGLPAQANLLTSKSPATTGAAFPAIHGWSCCTG